VQMGIPRGDGSGREPDAWGRIYSSFV